MDAIMGYSREQLEGVLRVNEQEIIELLDMNKELLRRIKNLENEIQVYKEHVKSLEEMKVDAKASKSVWKTIAISIGAFFALFLAIFRGENNK
jgi:cell division septum initiation protein DivIVA